VTDEPITWPSRLRPNRRQLFAGGLATAAATLAATAPAARSAPAPTGPPPLAPTDSPDLSFPGSTITRSDGRYRGLQTGNNQRFVATPNYVSLVGDTAATVTAVQSAADAGKRVSVRGGGHCFADFVCNPDVEVIIDTSPMKAVGYDSRRRAFVVEPGARLLDVYETLSTDWGVTIPGGICYSVGAGGHIAGGGYGLLSRAHGLVVDHLQAVEVVLLDARRQAKAVVASRDDTGALGDLFWAHTGGGGGNFGVVTRYWFRTPGATGTDPAKLLVPAPQAVLVASFAIPWEQLDRVGFRRLLANWGAWHEAHRAPGTPEANLSSLFNVSHRAHGSLGVFTQIDTAAPTARTVIDRFHAQLLDGTGATPQSLDVSVGELPAMPGMVVPRELPWLQATRMVGTNNPTITNPSSRGAHKSAYLRKSFTTAQVDVLFDQMTLPSFTNPDTMLVLFSFGGAVNAQAANASANTQRNSAFKMCLQTFWADAADDDDFLTWERDTFAGMFRETGGVPVPGDRMEGCYINYPDKDMTDPAYNRSGVPWQRLYYGDNYPRLQRAKSAWDPTNYFRHSMSVELPAGSR